MSKAFTREDDGEAPDAVLRPLNVPEGDRRPITPAGVARLEAERERLSVEKEALKERSDLEARAALREVEARLHHWEALLQGIQVTIPTPDPDGRILFGARVELRDPQGKRQRYQLVGPDEADVRDGRLSIQAPLARVLLGRRSGDTVEFERPAGAVELTIERVEYE
jgi:transcription elongation factor GreB